MKKKKETRGELLRKAIQTISKKWHSQIIYTLLQHNEASFKQIKDEIEGISNKVLSGSLKDLQEKDLVVKKEKREKSRYKLSKRGRDMGDMMNEALKWGEKYLSEVEKFNILVIEDDESQAKMYGRWLEDLHHVETANTGSEALEKLKEETDVVFLDRKLPDMNASEILEAAGKTLENKYVVMLTASEPEMKIIDLDIQEYLTKPVSQDDLEDLLQDIKEHDGKTRKTQRLWSLATKKSLLEDKKRREELEKEDRYNRLKNEINELKLEINDIPEKIKEKI